MADKKDKKPVATFGSIALQNYTAQRGYEIGQDTSLGETLKPAVSLLGEYAKNAEIERGKFLSSLPDDFKVELLPTSGKEAFTNFASDAKQKYSEAAGLAAKYSANPNSEQYRNAVKEMESIKGNLSNSFDSYTKLADLRQGYINNEKANNKPIAMDAKDEQIYTEIQKGEYKNFENTADGLVYNYKDKDGNIVEKIPFNELPNTKFVDSEMSTNVITSVLKNPYTAGTAGDNMENSLATANNEVQKLITTPEGYRQAVFNGFDGPKTKFIDYYVGEQFITNKNKTFLNGINDINGDNLITKDDMQNGVWSFKESPEGDAARIAFENKITDHKNNPNFDVKTQLSEFMNGIAKDKYLEGQAQKFKNKDYNLRGIEGGKSHDQIQGEFDKLNNHEPISSWRNTDEFLPVEGKPGLYYALSEDGKTRTEVTRDRLEKALDIFSIRGDFNTDPAKATTTNTTNTTATTTTTGGETTAGGETTIVNTEEPVVEVDGVTGATIKVDPPKENVIAQNIDEIEEGIDRDNITEEQVKSARKLISVSFGNWEKSYNKFPNTIKDADGLNKGLADIDEQLEVLLTADTKEKLEKGKKKTWYGGITRSYMYDRLSKARDKYKKAIDKMTPKPEKIQEENVESKDPVDNVKIPAKDVEKVEANLDPSIKAIEAGEVELKDTEGNVVVGSEASRERIAIDEIDYNEETSKDVPSTKKDVKGKASYNKTLGDSLIKEEGFREKMYYDMATPEDPTAGTRTIGYGYTRFALNGEDGVPSWKEYWNADGTSTGKLMSVELAKELKPKIVNRYVKQVNNAVKVDLTESQNNALVDLYYRNGAGNVAKSGIIELINEGKIEEAAELIKKGGNEGRLIKAGSKVLAEGDKLYKGINNRNNRAAENLLAGLETQDQTQA